MPFDRLVSCSYWTNPVWSLLPIHRCHIKTLPPFPSKTPAGKTRSRHGSNRITANASQVGLSHAGMILGLYPSGSGAFRKRLHTLVRVSSSKAHAALHSATHVS